MAVAGDDALNRHQGDALSRFAGTLRIRVRQRLVGYRGLEPRRRHHLVDEAPIDGAPALHAFLGGAEVIGTIATHFALVDDAGQPAGAGQNGEKRHFGQRHRRGAVVHQDDVVGRERELVAAAGGSAVDDADGAQARCRARILDGVAGLVGELAEVNLVDVARACQHADVGAGAKDARLAGAQLHHPHGGMLEPDALERVGKLDIDA